MKKEGKISSPKANKTTIKDLNGNETDEISKNKLNTTTIRMIK
jgi:hypothetical protein